jgi:LysR family transcriptional activator of nhaA
LEQWFQLHQLKPRVIAEFEDAALMETAALDGLGFIPVLNQAADLMATRYGFRLIGATEECRQQLYAISAERKLTHPAVVAITAKIRARAASG